MGASQLLYWSKSQLSGRSSHDGEMSRLQHAQHSFSLSLARAWSFRTFRMKVMWGSGMTKMAGISNGGSGRHWWATCLPLFFWIHPVWARVNVVAGGGGKGLLSRWWLRLGGGGGGDGGSSSALVIGVGMRVCLSSGRGGWGVWLTYQGPS